ncbi:ferritin-like domain-containing protein [Methylomagnum sp.]
MHLSTPFFDLAEDCLYSPSIEAKLTVTDRAAEAFRRRNFSFAAANPPRPASDARFPPRPRLVDPRKLPRRGLHTDAGRVAFLHAIAHIEFTAIQLAWDMAYRFRGMPEEFYYDWLQVAIEEVAHFRALCARLRDFGADYGQLPAHRGLWELAENTAGDVLHRLALVPRFMEARGLDVTPGMIAKLEPLGDAETVAVLEIVLREEIGHVAFGTRWFNYVCGQRGLNAEDEYFALVKRYIRGEVRGPFNEAARRTAGFSEGELRRLGNLGASGL